jgi:DNA-directed RNA polymerase specialized sigma24 family protein
MQHVLNAAVYNVWRSAGSFDPSKGDLAGWLYRIAQREVVNCLRQSKGNHGVAALDVEPAIKGRRPDDTSITDQPVVKELLEVIENLPHLQRAVIQADLAADGRADDERLARLHNSTVASVRATRTTARKKIREAMQHRIEGGQAE